MTIILFLQLAAIALFNAIAQIFVKKAGVSNWLDWQVVLNKNLWLGGFFYVAGFFWWVRALNQNELTVVVPLMTSLMYIATIFFGWYFFREQITLIKMTGILLICVGMFLVIKR